MDRDEYNELGRVGAGQTLELHQLFDRFHHDDGCASSPKRRAQLIEDLRQYVGRQFSSEPTPSEAVEFAKSAAKAMDLPATRVVIGRVWFGYSKALKPRPVKPSGTTSDDDDATHAIGRGSPSKSKSVRDDGSR